jgi:hypothetical protein
MGTKSLDDKVRKSIHQGAVLKINRSIIIRAILLISLMASVAILSGKIQADTGSCGGAAITWPFNDVMNSPFFCQIAAAYYSSLTNGTTATTYSPTQEALFSLI